MVVLLALALSAPAVSQPILEFVKLRDQGNWAGALEAIRREVANPTVKEASYLVDIRTTAIGALGNHAAQIKTGDVGYDQEARNYYEEAYRFAGRDGTRTAQLDNVMGVYYSLTGRNGFALPYFNRSLQFWTSAKDQYQIIRAYDALGSAYADIGELELSAELRTQAAEVAKRYFVVGKSPADPNLWLQYATMLDKWADSTIAERRVDELERIFLLRESITRQYLNPLASSYDRYARQFAMIGAIDRARQLSAQASQIWATEVDANRGSDARMQADFICTRFTIELAARNSRQAASFGEDCTKALAGVGVPLGPNEFREQAHALELAGRLDEALRLYEESIRGFEQVRGSYAVAERASFFNSSPVRRAYWGNIRSLATRSAASANPPELFFEAMSGVERIRARQFGDVTDPGGTGSVEARLLAAFAGSLPPDQAVVSLVTMDDRIIVLAFDRTSRRIATVPVGRSFVSERAALIWNQMSRARADTGALERELTELGGMIFDPVADIVNGKARLLIASDGDLSTIPVGLLSSNSRSYQPLVDSASVQLITSLRMLLRSGRGIGAGKGFIGIGDPVYPSSLPTFGVEPSRARALARVPQGAIFPALPETRTEVTAIAAMFAGEPTMTIFGQEAQKGRLNSQTLGAYRYIHFATHGVLGGEIPGLGEPALVLASDAAGDAFLRASDAAALNLNAMLTVLSACNTGSGRVMTGEGVLGMSRAFLLAGSQHVLVSLWPVDSKVTEELMVSFYRHERAGRDPDMALRAAMIEVRQQRRHPFYWAPFTLIRG